MNKRIPGKTIIQYYILCFNKIIPVKTSVQRTQAYRNRMHERPDNVEVTSHGPITDDERKVVHYLNNTFVYRSVAIAQEMPILFTPEEVAQLHDYSSKMNSENAEPINFDRAINPEFRRYQRQLWRNYDAEMNADGKMIRYTRHDLTEALRRQSTPPECLIKVISI